MLRMNLIKIGIGLFIMLIGAGTVLSQSMPGDRAGRMADRLYRDLQLTDEQYTRVYQALLNYEMQIDGSTNTGSTTTGTTNTTTTTTTTGSATDRLNTSMQGILNADQMTYYKNYDSNRRSGVRYNGTTNRTTNTNTNTNNNNRNSNNSGNTNNNNSNNNNTNTSPGNNNDVNKNFEGTPPSNDVTPKDDTNKQTDDLKDSGVENHDNKRMDNNDSKIEDPMRR